MRLEGGGGVTHWMLSRKIFLCRLAPPFPRPFPPEESQLRQGRIRLSSSPLPRPDIVDMYGLWGLHET